MKLENLCREVSVRPSTKDFPWYYNETLVVYPSHFFSSRTRLLLVTGVATNNC